MNVTDPVPVLDHTPHAAGAPPGVALRLNDYEADWVARRPKITPRVGVVHTNGGGGEGSYEGAIRWSNGGDSRTHAHYNLNHPLPSKNLATNRRAIANSTPSHVEAEFGVSDSSFWTIAIETADRGYNNGGGFDLGDFLYNHDELVARIIAYESIVWDIPILVPDTWTGRGWATHTSPWDGVYTIYKGKSCPGATKKTRMLGADWNASGHEGGDVLRRARHIYNVWTGAPSDEEVEMKIVPPVRIYDSRKRAKGRLSAGETRTIKVPDYVAGKGLMATVTAVAPDGKGYITVWGGGDRPSVSAVNFDGSNIANTTVIDTGYGQFDVFVSADTHLLVDVVGVFS